MYIRLLTDIEYEVGYIAIRRSSGTLPVLIKNWSSPTYLALAFGRSNLALIEEECPNGNRPRKGDCSKIQGR